MKEVFWYIIGLRMNCSSISISILKYKCFASSENEKMFCLGNPPDVFLATCTLGNIYMYITTDTYVLSHVYITTDTYVLCICCYIHMGYGNMGNIFRVSRILQLISRAFRRVK